MRVSVILAHLNPQSFNHAIAQVAVEELHRRKHQVAFHNLYAEHFDPLPLASQVRETMHGYFTQWYLVSMLNMQCLVGAKWVGTGTVLTGETLFPATLPLSQTRTGKRVRNP